MMDQMCRRCVVLSLMMAVCCGLSAEVGRADSPPPAMLVQPDFRMVIRQAKARVFPAVVYIKVIQESHESGKRVNQESSGSGVLISADGELLTNWHVIDKAVTIRCLLSDGRAVEAEVISSDKSVDVALLRLKRSEGDTTEYPFAQFGDSDEITEGEFVMAMGAPWGLNRSVSIGIVSCTNRFLPESSEYSHWLQTDAAISPGNSGGPLVDSEGRIVGLNTLGIMYGGDMGFAVPINTIKELLPRMRQGGEVGWSWFGFQLQPLRDFNRDMYFDGDVGVIVSQTDPSSPARLAGFEPRDRIVAMNGVSLTAATEETLPAIRRQLGLLDTEREYTFDIKRGSEVLKLTVQPRLKGQVQGRELDCPRWDMTVKEVNQFDNPDLYFHRKQGVYVFGVRYPGNASSAGFREKDILLKINHEDVVSLVDIEKLHQQTLKTLDENPRVLVTVLRNGMQRQIVLNLSRDYEKK